jgi:hypothetical protein
MSTNPGQSGQPRKGSFLPFIDSIGV